MGKKDPDLRVCVGMCNMLTKLFSVKQTAQRHLIITDERGPIMKNSSTLKKEQHFSVHTTSDGLNTIIGSQLIGSNGQKNKWESFIKDNTSYLCFPIYSRRPSFTQHSSRSIVYQKRDSPYYFLPQYDASQSTLAYTLYAVHKSFDINKVDWSIRFCFALFPFDFFNVLLVYGFFRIPTISPGFTHNISTSPVSVNGIRSKSVRFPVRSISYEFIVSDFKIRMYDVSEKLIEEINQNSFYSSLRAPHVLESLNTIHTTPLAPRISWSVQAIS